MSRSINQQWSYLVSELRYFAFVMPHDIFQLIVYIVKLQTQKSRPWNIFRRRFYSKK